MSKQPDKSLSKPERIMLVGMMLDADYTGANESRERAFAAAMAEAVSDHDRNSEMTSSSADMRAAAMISRAHNR